MSPFLANISEQKKQRYLFIVFFIIMAITLIVFMEFYKKPKITYVTSSIQYEEVKIDFKIFENPLFQMLRPFEPISPLTTAPGRENPFLPF